MNALKHGLTATTPEALAIISERSGEDYEAILKRMRTHYSPTDPVEDELVKRISRCLFRLAMSSGMEERFLELTPSPGRPSASYERIMKFERLVDIHLHRAISTLAKKREVEKRPETRGGVE